MEKIVNQEEETDLKKSLVKTRDFLNFLKNYEDLPKFVKLDAESLLKDFPTDYNITRLFNR
mgnify:CR=1 FL=1|tara:strand:+ start:180 stop:362 length:183 start_codon:yes stop_codon:yes gene_type:complete